MYILAVVLFLLSTLEEPPERKQGEPETLPRHFRRVDDGQPLPSLINHSGKGHFIRAVPFKAHGLEADTLQIYVQGVVKGRVRPNRRKAAKADLVIWCFPSHYPHPNHVFPNAKGRVYVVENGDQITVATETFVKQTLEKRIDFHVLSPR